jgi:hypothetical protein
LRRRCLLREGCSRKKENRKQHGKYTTHASHMLLFVFKRFNIKYSPTILVPVSAYDQIALL